MPKPTINYSDFEKLEIKVGTIVAAENVENSNKLIKLTVDIGSGEMRTILTGMAKWYNPEDFKNMQTLVLTNLEPKKMAGQESQGMLLSIGTDLDSKPVFVIPKVPVDNGEGIS